MTEFKDFNISAARRGEEISEETYFHFLNMGPPQDIRDAIGFQLSEPYADCFDLRQPKRLWRRSLHSTFVKRDGRYYFEGFNFSGEVDSRPYIDNSAGCML